MIERQPIRSNIRWLAVANLAIKPAWFVFLLLSTRRLGADEFGRTMLALSFVSILATILDGGIDIHVIRRLSADPHDYPRLAAHSYTLRVISALAVAAVTFGLSAFHGIVPVGLPLILPALAFVLFNNLMNHARAFFRAFEVMRFEAISIMVEKGAVIALCLVPLILAPRAGSYLLAYAVAYGVTAAVTLIMARRVAGPLQGPVEVTHLWKGVLKPALPFALMNLFTIVYFRSGTLLLSYLTGRDELVGYYNAGYRLVESYMLFPTIVTGPLYPVLARRQAEGAALSPLLLAAARAILLVSLAITLPLTLFHRDFTALFFGPGFRGAATSVGIVVLAMIPVGMNFVFGSLVAASGRQPRGNVFIFIVTVLNVLLNLAAIPRFGAAGAAAVTVLTELGLVSGNLWVVRDYFQWVECRRLAIRVALAVAVAVAAGVLLGARLAFPLGPALTVAAFGAAAFGLRLVTLEDARRLIQRGQMPPDEGRGATSSSGDGSPGGADPR
jgi:O-antigen/teichoic acid export membrane protein